MKKIIALLGLVVLLSGCFGSDGTDTAPKTGYHTYGVENITINIPDEWEIITPAQFGSSVPANTIIAFKSNLKNPYFTPNVTVVKGAVSPTTITSDYVKSLQHTIATQLVSFKDIGAQAVALSVGGATQDTSMIRSEGSEVPQTDLKHFWHVPVISNGVVYTAVGSSLATADEAETAKIETIISSLVVK